MQNDISCKESQESQSGYTNIRQKNVNRDEEGHLKMIEESTYHEDVTIINIFVPTDK